MRKGSVGTPDRRASGEHLGPAAASLAPVCLAPLGRQGTLGFRVPRERASGARLAHLALRDLLALAMRGARAPLALLGPLGPPHFLAHIGRLSAFLDLLVLLGPQDPQGPWAPLQG